MADPTIHDADGHILVRHGVKVTREKGSQEVVKQKGGTGWYITLISRDGRENDVEKQYNDFETGIQLEPPLGWRLEISMLPELLELGYEMFPMQIDRTNCNEPIVVKIKKFKSAEDMALPMRALLVRIVQDPVANFFDSEPERKIRGRTIKPKKKSRRDSDDEDDQPKLRKGKAALKRGGNW